MLRIRILTYLKCNYTLDDFLIFLRLNTYFKYILRVYSLNLKETKRELLLLLLLLLLWWWSHEGAAKEEMKKDWLLKGKKKKTEREERKEDTWMKQERNEGKERTEEGRVGGKRREVRKLQGWRRLNEVFDWWGYVWNIGNIIWTSWSRYSHPSKKSHFWGWGDREQGVR